MRYVLRDGQLTPKHTARPRGGLVMSDIKEFVTQDGVPITSRSHLRAYEQRNGVKQIGNDIASEVAKIKEKINGGLG